MGDKNFLWYTARREDAEYWDGTYDSREQAIAAGKTTYDGDNFVIQEADKMTLWFHDLFDGEDDEELGEEECFIDPDWAINRWGEHSEELWGEDGFEGLEGPPLEIDYARTELKEALVAARDGPEEGRCERMSKAFEAWGLKYVALFPRPWCFCDIRNFEEIKLKPEKESA